MEKKETQEDQSPLKEDRVIDLSTALLISENTLEPQPDRYLAPEERPFKSSKEFFELIMTNTGSLFGKNTLFIDATQSPLECHVLIDYTDPHNKLLHLVGISFSKENFWQVFARISQLFTLMTESDYKKQLTRILYRVITEHKETFDEVVVLAGAEEKDEEMSEEENKERIDSAIEEFLEELTYNEPFIILISDQERPEVEAMCQTYASNWGKYIVPMVMERYANEGALYLAVSPLYSDIEWEDGEAVEIKTKPASEKTAKAKKTTEADHLQGTQQPLQLAYQKMKADMLKFDAGLQFNPSSYYISMRKAKNLAFFHLKKKSIWLVVMLPEAEVRKLIKHHQIKSLAESVQKYWNGPSCGIVIEGADKIEEVIALLKKLIR